MTEENINLAVKAFELAMLSAGRDLRDQIEASHGVKLDFCTVCGTGGIYAAFGNIADEDGMAGALLEVIDEWDNPLFTATFDPQKVRPS